MNSNKVSDYIANKVKDLRKYHPKQAFKNFDYKVYNGSFGSILISLSGDYYSIPTRYVTTYEAIDSLISEWVHYATHNLYARYWDKHHKSGARAV